MGSSPFWISCLQSLFKDSWLGGCRGEVECRRREFERRRCGRGCPPQKFFLDFWAKRQVLVHPVCYFLQLINLNWMETGLGRWVPVSGMHWLVSFGDVLVSAEIQKLEIHVVKQGLSACISSLRKVTNSKLVTDCRMTEWSAILYSAQKLGACSSS